MANLDSIAIENFQKYLCIKTVQPNPDYAGAIKYLENLSKDVGLDYHVVNLSSGFPVFIMIWKGNDPNLKSIMLNSHIDVVPVYEEFWSYDPFAAKLDETTGNIYARGTQDMKSVGIQYVEAIRRMKSELGDAYRPKRSIYVVFVPDEEVGGGKGMKLFVKEKYFLEEMNVGFYLDEGLANPDDAFAVYYGERLTQWIKFTCKGTPGHALQLMDNPAIYGFNKLLTKCIEFREEQVKKLKNGIPLGKLPGINVTLVSGGVQPNVVPPEFSFIADYRVPPSMSVEEFDNMIFKWIEECGSNITYEWIRHWPAKSVTNIDPKENFYWREFEKFFQEKNLKMKLGIFEGGTDAKYLREIGIPAIGFSPMNNTPVLLHDHDEFLNKDVFLRGIEIYKELIPALSDKSF